MAEEEGNSGDGSVAEIEQKIIEAFEVFDHEGSKTVDVRNYTAETAAAELREKKRLTLGQHPHAGTCTDCQTAASNAREIGAIVRSLGCFPTEAELHELLSKVEEEEPTGYIHLEKFLPVMTTVLLDRSFRPIPEDVLLHAFEALDENKCGYITKQELVRYLTKEGEPFAEEEMEDMLSVVLDPETNTVPYREYISKMIVDES